MRKTDAEYLEYMWPMRHFLITYGDIQKEANIIAVSFCMPVSKVPPMIACAIGLEMYSCSLIERTKEFIVNVPTQDLTRHIYYCGSHSGREVNKFQATGLTPQSARSVKAPIIAECVAHMECRVERMADNGDKRLFIGIVMEAYADEDMAHDLRAVEYAVGAFPKKIYGTRFT